MEYMFFKSLKKSVIRLFSTVMNYGVFTLEMYLSFKN